MTDSRDRTSKALTTRDTLAKALWMAEAPHEVEGGWDVEGWAALWDRLQSDLLPKRVYFQRADRLFASGAVIDTAALADDEALVDRAARAMLYRWPADEPVVEGDRDQARRALRALADALTERAS